MTQLPTSDVVRIERSGHVATVWLDRPEQLNALGPDFWIDFPAVMDALGADSEVRAIVIAGEGRAFCAGIDLGAFGGALAEGELGGASAGVAGRRASYDEIKRMQRTFSAISAVPQPVIAAIHGYCIGAGVDLITACDIRLASADAIFSVRETRIGMVADVGTLQRLPAIIDPGRVAEIVYTGKDFGAAEAAEMGLISHVHPDAATTQKEAIEMAAAIARNSPLAVQGSKAVLTAGKGRSVDEALDYVALWNAAFLHSSDLAEGVQAFAEKREPRFTGE